MKSQILKGDQELNYNDPISPPMKPSGRGELEITDVNNYYIDQGRMGYRVLDGYWSDAGTFGSLLRAGGMVESRIIVQKGLEKMAQSC